MKVYSLFGSVILFAILLAGCNNKSGQPAAGKSSGLSVADSMVDGEKSIYSDNGKLHYKVEYKNGKANGRVREYYANGNIYMDAIYKDGHRNGKCTHFYKNGKPFSVSEYKNGDKDGIETKYNENGKIMATIPYHKNKVQPGLIEYQKDGSILPDEAKLQIVEVDHSTLEGKYYIRVSLSVPKKNLKFYALTPSDADSREKLVMSGNSAVLYVPIPPSGFLMKKLIFEAEYKTSMGNTRRLQKSYNLLIEK
jgi:antitoxin component YwqK of YwqJK toxin-antitoxin module